MVSRGPCTGTQLAKIQNSSKLNLDERKICAISSSSRVESSDDIVAARISQAHTFEYGVEIFDVNDQNWCDLDVVGRTSFASNAKIARIDYQAIWIFTWSHKWCVHVALVIARRQQQTIPKWLIDRLAASYNRTVVNYPLKWNHISLFFSLQTHIVSTNGQTNNIARSIIRFDGHSTEVVSIPVICDCRTQPSGEKRVPDQRYEWENVTVSCHSWCPWTLALRPKRKCPKIK